MRVSLQPHVHAVRIGADLVFLDVKRDRYLCWPSADGLDLLAGARSIQVIAREQVDDLRAAGLVTDTPQETPPSSAAAISPPSGDLWSAPASNLDWRDRLDAFHAWRDAARFRAMTFEDLVAFGAARAIGADPDRLPDAEMRGIVAAFQAWAPWTPGSAKCLRRSFLLLRLLRRRGHDARWVIAVRTWPFVAHSWLQVGDLALDDACERLVAYRPILVI
jgi:hypothetical protein